MKKRKKRKENIILISTHEAVDNIRVDLAEKLENEGFGIRLIIVSKVENLEKEWKGLAKVGKHIVIFNFFEEEIIDKKGAAVQEMIKMMEYIREAKHFKGNLASYSIVRRSRQPAIFPGNHYIRNMKSMVACIKGECNCSELFRKSQEKKNGKNVQ